MSIETQLACFLFSDGGYLQLTGADRLNFLQRQTTNDVSLLRSDHTLATVLTSPTGRIWDVFYLLDEGETIGILTLPGYGARTLNFLRSRIFFMDKVALKDASADYLQLDLSGTPSDQLLQALGIHEMPPPLHVLEVQLASPPIRVRILNLQQIANLGYRLLVPAADAPALLQTLDQAGVTRLDLQDYHRLRIEAGIPAPRLELVDRYTPLETGLAQAISSNKGCYTGQEVIARQLTYDKVTQHLCGIQLQRATTPGHPIWFEDRQVGVITSTTSSARFGEIALGVVKRPHDQPGARLLVGEQPGGAIPAEVVLLPFSASTS